MCSRSASATFSNMGSKLCDGFFEDVGGSRESRLFVFRELPHGDSLDSHPRYDTRVTEANILKPELAFKASNRPQTEQNSSIGMPATGVIQDRARTEDAASFASRPLQGDMGHHVHGVGSNEHHSTRVLVDHFVNGTSHNGSVLLEKMEPCFVTSLGYPRRDDDHLGVAIVSEGLP